MRRLMLFLVIVFLLYGCGQKQQEEEITDSEKAELLREEAVEQKILQFDLTAYTDRGAKRWEVKGRSANMVDEVVELKDISATTYGEENALGLKADEGIYNKGSNTVHLEKNVVITTSDGARVLSDVMDWDSRSNVISTDSTVKVEREEITLSGKGVKGEPELRKAQFEEDIKIEMKNAKGPTIITCDGPLDIDYEKNMAVFNDNVKIVDEKGEVTSDKLYAYLNPETKAIVKAIAKGGVKILRGENYSYCEEAVYLPEERRVVLTGRPGIVIYPDEKFDASFFGDIKTGETDD